MNMNMPPLDGRRQKFLGHLVEACGRLGGGDGKLYGQAERTRQGRRLKNAIFCPERPERPCDRRC